MRVVRDAGWTLVAATETDIDEVMTWFPDARSVAIWGGPGFRYPFTGATFREDCRLDRMESFSLRNREGRLAAFGQAYERYGRGHLARLVSNPEYRGRGAGKQLVNMIVAALDERHAYEEYSLFVYRDNAPAFQCYLATGFVVTDYPADAPLRDECYFLTKKRREQ